MKTIKIGRNPENDIHYEEPLISGYHAEIAINEYGRLLFTDNSTNGTYLNGKKISHTTCEVTTKDEIRFPGDVILDWDRVMIELQKEGYSQEPIVEIAKELGPEYKFVGECPKKPSQENDLLENQSGHFSFSLALQEGFSSGLRNFFSLLGIFLLFVLTCWIPYLNVGTFIAISTLAPLWAQKEHVNPLVIFESRYRRVMGDFLLTGFLMFIGILIAMFFMYIPGIVLSYTWMLAPMMVVYKGMDSIKALQSSNQCTNGSKWGIFFLHLFFLGGLLLVSLLFAFLVSLFNAPNVGVMILFVILGLGIFVLLGSIYLGFTGSIWKQLTQNSAL